MSEKPREGAAETNAAQAPGAIAATAVQGQTPQTAATTSEQTPAPAPYAQAGEAFTNWFNDKVR